MGIVAVTAYPSRYANEPSIWEMEEQAEAEARFWAETSVDKFSLSVEVVPPRQRGETILQRELAIALGEALTVKPHYNRSERNYTIGGWQVSGAAIASDWFDTDSLPAIKRVLDALQAHGFKPMEMITVHFKPKAMNVQQALNFLTIIEARAKLISKALHLTDDLRVFLDERPALGLPMNDFSYEVIEACVYLLRQVSLQAVATRKARMKPSGGGNPKFEMRSWLLRMGFIGEEFARPRQTMLQALDGNSAFFDDESRERANQRRRMQRIEERTAQEHGTGRMTQR